MQIVRKITTGTVAVSLATATALSWGLAMSGQAGATTVKHHRVHCTEKNHHPYPPGRCFITFNKHKYHHQEPVKFHAERFKPHQRLRVHLQCGKFHKHVLTTHANKHGKVTDNFSFPKNAPTSGHCTVRVHGGGDSVKGKIKATS
ncbi:MAG TPA: hypothetical protein VFA96_02025 [Nocardioides sp.]|nr:hypothetical protein [Nocardioides sp.]